MAPNFALKTKIPLLKTVMHQSKKEKKQTAAERRQEQMKKARGRSANQLKEEAENDQKTPEKTETKAGYLEIEINLQRGDTEEELERNYQLKLKH